MLANRPLAARIIAFAACAVFLSGCLAKQVGHNGQQMRQALLDMYTDQLMDNLIRAHNNKPFVQVAYSNLTVQGDQHVGTTAGIDQTVGAERQVAIGTELLSSLTRTLTNAYSIQGDASNDLSLSFNANPITDQNDIYDHYIAFARNSSWFVASEGPPPCEVHCSKKCGKVWYWVPKEAGPAFLELAMRTTFQRGPEAVPAVPGAYERQIARVEKVELLGKDDWVKAYIVFNESVPNGAGVLSVVLEDGRIVRLPMLAVDQDITAEDPKEGEVLAEGSQTKSLRTQWSPKLLGFTQHNLTGRPARFYSSNYPPELPTQIASPLQQATNELRLIRVNTIKNRR